MSDRMTVLKNGKPVSYKRRVLVIEKSMSRDWFVRDFKREAVDPAFGFTHHLINLESEFGGPEKPIGRNGKMLPTRKYYRTREEARQAVRAFWGAKPEGR